MAFENYTGVKVIEVEVGLINQFYQNGGWLDLSVFDGRMKLAKLQNAFLVIKDIVPKDQGGTASALARVKGDKAVSLMVSNATKIAGIGPRNKEQVFSAEALLDDTIQLVVMTGNAGTGKTLLALATAIQKIEEKVYDRIILTKSMSQVGKTGLGFLPGDVMEKYLPFNQGYLCNLEALLGRKKQMNAQELVEQLPIEFIPIQLVRGASWPNSFIIVDEAQNLGHHETLSVGSRIGEGSKIVFLGDLNQRDERLSKEATGIFKITNSPWIKESTMAASIELWKSERSPMCALFAKVFEEQEDGKL